MKKINILKIFLFLLFVFGLAGISPGEEQAFKNYRYNPFQFPYEEYYFKAETKHIDSQIRSRDDRRGIQFFEFSATLPEEYYRVEKKSEDYVVIRSEDNHALLIQKEKEDLMGCTSEKIRKKNRDFCSIFVSTEDFYKKLFTLTPEDLEKPKFSGKGYAWIVHRKGMMFNRVSKIHIYKNKHFTAYRSDFKAPEMSSKSELIIFPENIKPDYITVTMNFLNEPFINDFLTSLRPLSQNE